MNALPGGLESVEAFLRESLSPTHRDDLAAAAPPQRFWTRSVAVMTPPGRPTPTVRAR